MLTLLRAAAVASALACRGSGPARIAADPDPAPVHGAVRASEADTAGATAAAPAVVREEAVVQVGGARERWALVWRQPPRPVCAWEAGAPVTCPCEGFAYGEAGALDLVRRRPGRPDERLPLTPLFADGDTAAGPPVALLRRWPVLASDDTLSDAAALERAVRARPAVRALALGDYDHDGRATEFVLQVWAGPCYERAAVLVGVSAGGPALHAFGSVAHPGRPLVLSPELWEALRRSGTGAVAGVEMRCGVHGAPTQREVRLRAGPAGIDATEFEYACAANMARGRLLRVEPL